MDTLNLDYNSISNIRSMFQRSGGRSYTGPKFKLFDFTQTDTPGWNYFKILFDFDSPFLSLDRNPDEELNPESLNMENNIVSVHKSKPDKRTNKTNEKPFNKVARSGITAGEMDPNIQLENTAYNYLLLNGEYERADLLVKFVQLLSDINSLSPWYFQEVSGLAEAVAKGEYLQNDFKPVSEERKQFTIKCLPDAIDNRIGTLLDLYDAICFSHATRRVIVPANLRKFDVSIYIFNTKIGYTRKHFNWASLKYDNFVSKGLHIDASFGQKFKGNSEKETTEIAQMNNKSNPYMYVASSKMFTFHNCEFDLRSNASAYSTLNNADGWQNEFGINIMFDMCYEQRYNEFIRRFIGDMIAWDVNYKLNVIDEKKKYEAIAGDSGTDNLLKLTKDRLNLDTKYGVFNMIGDAIGNVVDGAAANFLGNIFRTNFMTAMGSPEELQHYALSKAGKYANQLVERGQNELSELGTKAKGAIKQGAKNLWDDTVHHNKQERRQIRQQRREDRQRAREYKKESKSSGIGTNLHKK